MGLFWKRKDNAAPCCGAHAKEEEMQVREGVSSEIKVLGSGCAKCEALEKAVQEALKELGLETRIEHVTDFAKIAAYGVMTTPALVISNEVVSSGKVLKKDEVMTILMGLKNNGSNEA